jgi:hypothetical protein
VSAGWSTSASRRADPSVGTVTAQGCRSWRSRLFIRAISLDSLVRVDVLRKLEDVLVGEHAQHQLHIGVVRMRVASPRSVGHLSSRAISSCCEIGGRRGRSTPERFRGVRIVFGSTESDLIVPTKGVHRVSGLDDFAPADPLVFPDTAAVDGSSFWVQDAFARKILEWL